MNLKQAMAKIEELEQRVRDLESRPTNEIRNYYPQNYGQPLWSIGPPPIVGK